jgi:predicted nucleotidyltransferase
MTSPLVPPELLDPVVAYFQPRRVILFGSVALGEAGPDSNIDLPVVLDDDAPKEKLTIRADVECRIIARPTLSLAERRPIAGRMARIAGTLAYEAKLASVVIYERK